MTFAVLNDNLLQILITSIRFLPGLLLGEANSYQSLGDAAAAQKKMQQAHGLMHTAIGLSSAADGMYGTAGGIMGGLGGYANQAVAAGYHAEYMLNPDMPPPPQPIV